MANAFIFIRMDFLSYGYGLVWFRFSKCFVNISESFWNISMWKLMLKNGVLIFAAAIVSSRVMISEYVIVSN